MIKKYLNKIMALGIIATSIMTFSPIGVNAEWKQNSDGWWWYTEGDSWATGWRNIDSNWYYFDSNGYMIRNTMIGKYYVNENGAWVDDSKYNVTAVKAQEIVKQYFLNKGTVMPQNIKVEQDCGNSWGVHCYDAGPYSSYAVTYGWYFIDKTTGNFVSR